MYLWTSGAKKLLESYQTQLQAGAREGLGVRLPSLHSLFSSLPSSFFLMPFSPSLPHSLSPPSLAPFSPSLLPSPPALIPPFSPDRSISHQDSNVLVASIYIEREEEEGRQYGQMQQWYQRTVEEVNSRGLETTDCDWEKEGGREGRRDGGMERK